MKQEPIVTVEINTIEQGGPIDYVDAQDLCLGVARHVAKHGLGKTLDEIGAGGEPSKFREFLAKEAVFVSDNALHSFVTVTR